LGVGREAINPDEAEKFLIERETGGLCTASFLLLSVLLYEGIKKLIIQNNKTWCKC
jgi:hypothetical protein